MSDYMSMWQPIRDIGVYEDRGEAEEAAHKARKQAFGEFAGCSL